MRLFEWIVLTKSFIGAKLRNVSCYISFYDSFVVAVFNDSCSFDSFVIAVFHDSCSNDSFLIYTYNYDSFTTF